MMSPSLALRNVKKSLRDYGVYFLTLTFGVCIFYIFNSLESQQIVMELTSRQAAALRTLDKMMGIFSVFISCILGFLIIYANRFLIRRRQKEFGIYMILGMGKWQISRILVLETVLVGAISLFTGLLLGVFLSQGMAMVTAKLMGAAIGRLRFVFSPAALRSTIFCFGLTFILVLIFNVGMIQRQKLIDLIYADRKNEGFKVPRLTLSVALFLLSLLCLGAAYAIMLLFGLPMANVILLAAVALGTVGTFLFFFSLSGFFLRLLRQNKGLYLKNLNMFVLRQINSKINTAYVSMTFVCLMLFLSICALSSGVGLAGALAGETRRNAPFDASLTVQAPPAGIDPARVALEKGVDLDAFAKEYLTLQYYDVGVKIPLNTGEHAVEAPIYFLKLSDYNALLSRQGLPPLVLGPEEYAISSNLPKEWPAAVRDYMAGDSGLTINGVQLRTSPARLEESPLVTSAYWAFELTGIARDQSLTAADLPVIKSALHINYPQAGEPYETLCLNALSSLELTAANGSRLNPSLETKARVLEGSNSTTTTVAYLAIYLGIIFLLASATVLSIAQLSETSDNIRRYGLLRQIGTDEKMINGALFAQILIYFGVPLFLALIHSLVGLKVGNDLIRLVGDKDIWSSGLFAAAVILLIYGGYFLATYWSSKNMLKKE
ncbi:MAG: ABC transporter permease [Peptococcaceae bacterium]|jgi:putative ABC transport system permease protein|nr:ABC transporter permease [Peptococcaceae bacterium]